jgi:hypothetical protein
MSLPSSTRGLGFLPARRTRMSRPAWITACCAWMDCGRGGGDCGAAGAAAHACEGDRGCCGREADAAGTSAAGALDAGWTVWMRQNRAPSEMWTSTLSSYIVVEI